MAKRKWPNLSSDIPQGVNCLVTDALAKHKLLSDADPSPVLWMNRQSDAAVLLLCEHAGNAIPTDLHQLGISPEQLNSHIGWDIGAAALARKLAIELQAPLILQNYSRLLIDCNRPPNAMDSIPETSDGVTIPANCALTVAEKQARYCEVFKPLDNAIAEGLARCRRRAVFSIHSFTPQLKDQQSRPWHAGFLSRTDQHTANALMEHIKQKRPELTLALNDPYRIDDDSDWFIPRYAEARNLAHCLVEIRNDQLLHSEGVEEWAAVLASAIKTLIQETA